MISLRFITRYHQFFRAQTCPYWNVTPLLTFEPPFLGIFWVAERTPKPVLKYQSLFTSRDQNLGFYWGHLGFCFGNNAKPPVYEPFSYDMAIKPWEEVHVINPFICFQQSVSVQLIRELQVFPCENHDKSVRSQIFGYTKPPSFHMSELDSSVIPLNPGLERIVLIGLSKSPIYTYIYIHTQIIYIYTHIHK